MSSFIGKYAVKTVLVVSSLGPVHTLPHLNPPSPRDSGVIPPFDMEERVLVPGSIRYME